MSRNQLSALEAAFLYAESAVTPMHIGSLSIFDGAPWRREDGSLCIDALRRHVEERLPRTPRLLQYPAWPLGPLGRPYWTEDPDFDISRHVRRLTLRAPGHQQQLMEAVADLHMRLLDRRHPLWEMWFVDGLADGRVALIDKIHHAVVDGIGGVDVTMLKFDLEARPSVDGRVDGSAGAGHAGRRRPPAHRRLGDRLELVGRALLDAASEPVELVGRSARLATHPVRAVAGGWQLATGAADMARALRTPHTSLNDPIGARRRYRVVRRSLEQTRRTAHALGGSVNDAVLAAVGGAVHDLLQHRGDDGYQAQLHALVPVSMRADDQHESLGNKVAAMVVPLDAGPARPEKRFAAAHSAVATARQHHQVELSAGLLQMAEYLPEPVLASASGLIHHQSMVNVVITNVPGPPVPLYLMGARMLEMCPIVPLGRNLDVSVGILSYDGQLVFGLWADRSHVPDLDLLARGIERGLTALDRAAAAPV